ncbi:MAG: amidohydrolase [Pseudomonadota bacterium]|nr:amidohydrolase [Pseudomonadota bacterium]
MSASTAVFEAQKILTMDPHRPIATHVAVREGRILGVGALDEVEGWGAYDLDRSFADKILMPGLVEGHSHVTEGAVWKHTYVGFYDRRGPDGTLWRGLGSIEEVLVRLREAERRLGSPDQPLVGWGFDPIFLERPMVADDLDSVSTTRPVLVIHASFHLLNVNTVLMERAGITASTEVQGILKDEHGKPTGQFQSMAANDLIYKALGAELLNRGSAAEELRLFGRSAVRAGVTTVTDMFNDLPEAVVENYRAVTADPGFPVRLVPAFNGVSANRDGAAYLHALTRHNTGKLRFGLAKLVLDGSIQGFTARLKWPGYYNGKPNGVWNIAPGELKQALLAYHKAGFQVHIHVNGDEASEFALDAIEAVLAEAPRFDHRHTLQHCQMADAAQFRRMAALGVCVNLFCNHIFYWGDAHYAETMGPDRAERMDAVATAVRCGVPVAMHSDAPITPLAPLFTAWCAVNRRTASGRLLGSNERIPVETALQAITLGAAHTLKMDREIGSIEVGKFADFAVLEDDPTEVPPEALRDVRVWGTVLGGQVFPAPRTQ